jgi:hypothetical protein
VMRRCGEISPTPGVGMTAPCAIQGINFKTRELTAFARLGALGPF